MAKYFNIIDALEALETLLEEKLCCIATAVGAADQDNDVPSLESLQTAVEAVTTAITEKGGTWGASTTLPTVQAVVFRDITGVTGVVDDYTIPASLWWTAEVLNAGIVTQGANTISQYQVAGAEVRPDGQANLAVTLVIPDGVTVRVNYQPL